MGTRIIALASSSLVVLAVAAGISATSFAQEPKATFQGVWRTVEVVVPGPTGRTFRPEATLAIFHGRHYSRVEVHAEQPRHAAGRPGDGFRRPAARRVGTLRRRSGHLRGERQRHDHDAGDGREESGGDARRGVERLHLPARRRHVDADPGSHARGSESRIRSRSS